MDDLEPVAGLMIDRYDEFSSAYLKYQVEHSFWHLSYIPNRDMERIKSRILLYLARIQTFHFSIYRDPSLWRTLAMLGSGCSLCPNLQELRLDIRELGPWKTFVFTPLLSPSLRSITLYGADKWGEMVACGILDALRFRNANISHISYEGYTSSQSRIITRMMDFSNLKTLSIPSCLTVVKGDYKTIIASFLQTRSLTTLDINLGGYPNDMLYQLGKWFETLVSLTSLTLRGPLRGIHHCIHDLNPITSVYSFGLIQDLTIPHPEGQTVHLVPLFATTFPNLRSLHLENANDTLPKIVTLNDLMSLWERQLQALDLIYCLESTELADDIVEILRAWPTLERLWIEGGEVSARYILPLISRSAPSLQDLTLPLRSPGVSGE